MGYLNRLKLGKNLLFFGKIWLAFKKMVLYLVKLGIIPKFLEMWKNLGKLGQF